MRSLLNILVRRKIRQLRQKAGISQEALAGVLGISVQAVSKWENEQSYPDIGFLPQDVYKRQKRP